MTSYIEVQNLSHEYGRRQVLKDINLIVSKGSVTALLGANGAGKTTLLRIIAGLEMPTTGRIMVQSERADYKMLRKMATMVFQKAVTFNSSVSENVAYGLKARGVESPEIEKKVHNALKTVGLEGFENRRAKRLSGGEQQRLSLARALALEPSILLLDEPSANLDPRNASIIENVITSVNRDLGTTIIMASHNLTQAKQLADRVAVLQEGALVNLGSTQEVLDNPPESLVRFARVQNIFSGEVHGTENDLSFVDIGRGVTLQTTILRQGAVNVFIRPEDILVSKMPLVSSARNVLKGTVTEISDMNQLVQLKVDAGIEFITVVTRRSCDEMKLRLGSEIFLTFKAQSVHLIE